MCSVSASSLLTEVAPEETIEHVKGWLRLWVAIPNAVAGIKPPERDLLIVIDEMPRLGYVNGGAKRDHYGGVKWDHLAAAGLSPQSMGGSRARRGVPSTGRRGGARGRDLWAHGVKRGLSDWFSSPSGFDACGSG